MKTAIEKITADNRRPGLNPEHKWLVRYNRSNAGFGWLSCKTFETEQEAKEFAETKES